MTDELKILSVGNSFSVDTMEHLARIAFGFGVRRVMLGNLYVGGCSIAMHLAHAEREAAVYEYRQDNGSGWLEIPGYGISDAVKRWEWDWISIQHGSRDGSRYSSPKSYEGLEPLVKYLRERSNAKIAFNMNWIDEPDSTRPEIVSYGGDQLEMYRKTVEAVRGINCVDRLVPCGTAVQNARTAGMKLTRDGFHLDLIAGRYIAGLTFFGALTGMDISSPGWVPDEMCPRETEIAVEAAVNALKRPFEITESECV